MVRGTFSLARAWRPAVVARLARTLGLTTTPMRLSPGEQKTPRRVSPARVLVLLLPALAAFWLWNTRYPPIREYRLYFSEDRKSADLPWHLLSEFWSEADLKQHFTGYPVRCGSDHTGAPGITRTCAVDLSSLNGVPTMYLNFLFSGNKLKRVATATPWSSHSTGLRTLITTYGNPQVTQEYPHSGVRLHGWKLNGGGYVFYNRDRGLNPLEPSSTQWLAPSACSPRPCIQ